MIFGSINVTRAAITTHRDSYDLGGISVVSVRRPFAAPAILIGGGLAGFSATFADLLFAAEIAGLSAIGGILLIAGFWLGQLKLLSRDLRQSELVDAVWGSYRHLNQIRRVIVAIKHDVNMGGRT